MRFSELVRTTASRRQITDEGLGQPLKDGDRARALSKGLQDDLANYRAQKSKLQRLGVAAREISVHDRGGRADHDYFDFTAADSATASVARLAFAMGYYYGCMQPKFLALLHAIKDHQGSKKKGVAGGDAKEKAKWEKYFEIRESFANWAVDPRNEKAGDRQFIDQLYARKRRGKGYSRATIGRAIETLYKEILDARDIVAAGRRSTKRPDHAVLELLQNVRGVNLATVSRALSVE